MVVLLHGLPVIWILATLGSSTWTVLPNFSLHSWWRCQFMNLS